MSSQPSPAANPTATFCSGIPEQKTQRHPSWQRTFSLPKTPLPCPAALSYTPYSLRVRVSKKLVKSKGTYYTVYSYIHPEDGFVKASQRLFYTLYSNLSRYLVAALLALGFNSTVYSYSTTLLDDDSGAIKAEELRLLPMGPSWLTAAESFYLPVVMSSHDLGSFALTERSYVNLNGYSALWQKTYLNHSDISHPGEPGKALIDIPLRYAQSLQLRSLLAGAEHPEGWHYRTRASPVNYMAYNYGMVATVGGPAFIGAGVFDREPPQLWGAPEETRSFLPSHELDAQAQVGNTRVFGESILHRRNFITTRESEFSARHTVFAEQALSSQTTLTLGFQHLSREQEGADLGESDAQVRASRRLAALAKFDTVYRGLEWNLATGFGQVQLGNTSERSMVKSVEDEINQRPAVPPLRQLSLFVDSRLNLGLPSPLSWGDMLQHTLHLRGERVSEALPAAGYTIARTHLGSGMDVLTLQSGSALQRNLLSARYSAALQKEDSDYRWQLEAGLKGDALANDNHFVLGRMAPVALVKGSLYFNNRRAEVFAGLRHDITPLTHQEARLLAGNTAWRRHYWHDLNSDGMYQSGEAGALLPRSGAAYISPADDLSVPFFEELVVGTARKLTHDWQLVGRTVFRYYSSLYQIGMAERTGATYEKVARDDIEGGYAFNRTDNNIGGEFYELTNQREHSTYFALELQLMKLRSGNSWFLNASGGAYLHLGYPPAGNDVLHNDIGVVNESTADPNGRLNLWGRTDYDRGYMFKIITGFMPMKHLTWSNTIHYRDGIPVGRVKLADGLAQGPTVVQHSLRANAEEGIGRFVFYMQWDTRLIYEREDHGYTWFVAFDIYNVNGFRLELKERFFADHNYRDPTESMTPRTIRISAGARF